MSPNKKANSKSKKPTKTAKGIHQLGPNGKSHAAPIPPGSPPPPPERPPREYPKGVPRQAYLTPEAQEFNKNPKGSPKPFWPPMRSTIPPEPDRTDLRRVPFRDWWVLFCIAVLAWFIYAHANGYSPIHMIGVNLNLQLYTLFYIVSYLYYLY